MLKRAGSEETLPVVAHFEVHRRAYLAPDGTVLRQSPDFAADTDLLISFYRAMVLARTFDLKAVSLQRTGSRGGHRERNAAGRRAVALLPR